MSPEPMTVTEYEKWFCYGAMPDRFHAEEFERAKADYLSGEITLEQLENTLDQVVGL